MPLLVNLRLLVLVAFTSGALFAQQKLSLRPPDALNPAAFEHFYDMDYEHSIQEFTQISQRHPGDPNALNHLLTAVLFRELYRIGALNAGNTRMTVLLTQSTVRPIRTSAIRSSL